VWRRILELYHPDHSWRAAGYICTSQNSNARSPDGAVAMIGAMAPGKAKAWLERRFALA
jgi:hypothetical protein